MIARLSGTVLEKHPMRVVLDVGGVGYDVHVPLSSFSAIGEAGAALTLRIHTHVREDALLLFGFASTLEQALFERLIAVSGIGPKLALSVLSGLAPNELVQAISGSDVARLTSIPGIGKKTAERIVLELKEKLGGAIEPGLAAVGDGPSHLVARDALVELGYSLVDAERALADVDPELPAEERVRLALRGAAA